jgi:hypothetical protein
MGNGAGLPRRTAVSTARQAVRAELLAGPVGGCVEAGPAAQTGSWGAGPAFAGLGAAVAGLGAAVAGLGAAGPSRAAARAHEQAIVRIFTLATSRRGFGGSTPGTDRG